MSDRLQVDHRRMDSVAGLQLDTPPMEAKVAGSLPAEAGLWQFEPKWDGFRCLAFREGNTVELRAKSGKPLGRYFPEIVALLRELKQRRFVVDGELVIEAGEQFSFEALQMRLHPAQSRICKLSHSIPATLILFDMLVSPDGEKLIDRPLAERRSALEDFVEAAGNARLRVSRYTNDPSEAARWLDQSGGATDGVVAKGRHEAYRPGERVMIKVKRLRTADCVVGGFRYLTGSAQVGSLLLGLFNDEGKLDHVGFTSTIAAEDRAGLTERLEALRAPPGFTGKKPGGPSRWSTGRSTQWEPLDPVLVAEVRFDHVMVCPLKSGPP